MSDLVKDTVGNLFEAKTEALINAVNCVSIMGKGIALQFKQKFPADYFNAYKIACQNGELAIGSVQVYELKNAQTNPHYIINFPTKRHWCEPSRVANIESGLQSLVEAVERSGIKSIAIPALGCGLGGLDYREVNTLIERAFVDLASVEVFLYPPR